MNCPCCHIKLNFNPNRFTESTLHLLKLNLCPSRCSYCAALLDPEQVQKAIAHAERKRIGPLLPAPPRPWSNR